MLKYLSNNFVLAAIMSLAITIFVYSNNRKRESHPTYMFYLRLFAVSYGSILSVLYIKTKNISLPFGMSGGASAPSVGHAPSVNTRYNPGNDIGLETVNIGDPTF